MTDLPLDVFKRETLFDYAEYGFGYGYKQKAVFFIVTGIITDGYLSTGSNFYWQRTLGL